MQDKIDFHLLNDQFLNWGAVSSPAELQGLLCGKLCGGLKPSAAQWLEDAGTFLDLENDAFSDEQSDTVHALYELTLRLIDDLNFSFSPLLPGDETSLERRTLELSAWCQGFLHGLGTSGLSGNANLGVDVADALRDLAQICQVSVDADDDIEENEGYWVEIVEYVKVAVLTVYTELAHVDDTPPREKGSDDGKPGETFH